MNPRDIEGRVSRRGAATSLGSRPGEQARNLYSAPGVRFRVGLRRRGESGTDATAAGRERIPLTRPRFGIQFEA